MKTYTCFDTPLKVFGIPFFDEKKKLERVPGELREKIMNLEFLGRRCPGARIGFRTNSRTFTVRVKLKTFTVDIGMSIYASQSVCVMIGDRQNAVFAGLVNPPNYQTMVFERTFHKSETMEEITLWLLRNEEIEIVEVEVEDDAIVEAPSPYKYGKALFYGSSITEGGCCCSVTNSYTALLSRWLDLDYYNFGFSNSARGELEMADYINTIDMNFFIMDYDHNAPTAEHLQATHEAFFKRIREKHPLMPVLFLSRPNFRYSGDGKERRAVVEQTYRNALNAGDKNVYYIDGEQLFGEEDWQLCTIDTTHPNDLGSYKMAKAILPVMKEMLGRKS